MPADLEAIAPFPLYSPRSLETTTFVFYVHQPSFIRASTLPISGLHQHQHVSDNDSHNGSDELLAPTLIAALPPAAARNARPHLPLLCLRVRRLAPRLQ